MKSLSLERVMNWIGIGIGIVLMALVVFNIAVYGISDTSSFEF